MDKDEKIYRMHADLCKLLANPTRIKILEEIKDEEKSVSEIASAIDVRQPTTSQHLAELRKRGIITGRKEGTHVYYKLTHPKIIKACELVREVVFEKLSKDRELSKGSDLNG